MTTVMKVCRLPVDESLLTTFLLPSGPSPWLGLLVLLILLKLLVMSFFFMLQFVFNFFIFLPAASAIFDKFDVFSLMSRSS